MRLASLASGAVVERAGSTGRFVAKRASSDLDLARARSVVYRFYAEKGYLEPDPALAAAVGTFHADATHASLLARRRGQVFYAEGATGDVVATGTLIKDTKSHVSPAATNFGLPLDAIVPREMASLRRELGPNAVLGEIGGLASESGACDSGKLATGVLRALRTRDAQSAPVTSIFASMISHAKAQGITDIVAGVHPTHAQFYLRLGFREPSGRGWGPLPQYNGLRNADVVFLHASVERLGFFSKPDAA